jgi:hypothetical protein
MVNRTSYFYASSCWYRDPNNWIPSFTKRDDINIDLSTKMYIGNKLILQGSFHQIFDLYRFFRIQLLWFLVACPFSIAPSFSHNCYPMKIKISRKFMVLFRCSRKPAIPYQGSSREDWSWCHSRFLLCKFLFFYLEFVLNGASHIDHIMSVIFCENSVHKHINSHNHQPFERSIHNPRNFQKRGR